ncbi:MAG: CrcB family protein [Halioglobus sp.]|nr:CrcB family protein [Halioglobus sp.]
MNLTALLFVGGGGALGAIARYLLTLLMLRFGNGLPLGTLLSNLLGCLFMGAALQWLAEAHWTAGTGLSHEPHRLLLAVGFCGSFTTLSALIYELSSMLQRNELLTAFAYLLTTIGGGFLFFYLGVVLLRAVST